MRADKRKGDQSGARAARSSGLGFRLHTYVQRHLYAFFASLGHVWRSPLATLMTTLAIAVTLALPAGLVLLIKSFDGLTADWQGAPKISLYAKPGSTPEMIAALVKKLQTNEAVSLVEEIPPEQGMQVLGNTLEMKSVLELFDENPLPHVLVLEAGPEHHSPQALEKLVEQLATMPSVDVVQLDLQWLKKLNAILGSLERGIWVISALLAVAVLLTIGNSIRLTIQSKLEEIEVMKLVGAKDAFIRRPFLYGGFWLGLISGLLALGLLFLSYLALREPILQVIILYDSLFHIPVILMLQVAAGLVVLATSLGWLGAWLAVGRQLRRIEPS